MKELVEVIAKALVDNPDEVVVTEKTEGKNVTVELHVAASDMGKVIGKQGRIAKAIRTIVRSAAGKVEQKVAVEIDQDGYCNPNLKMDGVVFTMYDARTNLSLQVVENVKDNLNQNIYKTIIPRNVRLAEAPSYGMPINLYDPKSKGTESYLLLAEEVINKGEE